MLSGTQAYRAAPTVLPAANLLAAAERRRTGRVVKLALGIAWEAVAQSGANPAELASVFSSSGGDGDNCHELCQALALAGREISPTRFANSVHNAAAGYWSIGTGAMAESNVLCAYDASFVAGLLEALTQIAADRVPVLLVAYDSEYPQPLHAKRPIPDCFGVAMVLTPQQQSGSLAKLCAAFTDAEPDRLPDAALESLRSSIPAARCAAAAEAAGEPPGGERDSGIPGRAAHAGARAAMRLDRRWIEEHIPHSGRMCLLDEVIEWDAAHIRCRSGTHRAADHPLRSRRPAGHRLRHRICGAGHGRARSAHRRRALRGAAHARPAAGFLAGVRDLRLQVARFDDVEGDLMCSAALLAGDAGTALYEFALESGPQRLLSGRATVVFDANKGFKA